MFYSFFALLETQEYRGRTVGAASLVARSTAVLLKKLRAHHSEPNYPIIPNLVLTGLSSWVFLIYSFWLEGFESKGIYKKKLNSRTLQCEERISGRMGKKKVESTMNHYTKLTQRPFSILSICFKISQDNKDYPKFY